MNCIHVIIYTYRLMYSSTANEQAYSICWSHMSFLWLCGMCEVLKGCLMVVACGAILAQELESMEVQCLFLKIHRGFKKGVRRTGRDLTFRDSAPCPRNWVGRGLGNRPIPHLGAALDWRLQHSWRDAVTHCP